MKNMLLKHVSYYLLALCLSMGIFLGISWIPALHLWFTVLSGPQSLDETFSLSLRLFTLAIFDNSYTINIYNGVTSFLIGVNISLLIFYVRKYQAIPSKTGLASGAAGVIAAFLGFGCAACGTLFLTLLLTSIGATSVSVIPVFAGTVLQVFGMILLLVSTGILIRKVNSPLTCLI